MYLAKRKVKGRSIINPFNVDLPAKLSDEELDNLVTSLRVGLISESDREKIYMSHIRLTLQIVGRYANQAPNKIPDLIGEATLALAEAIKNAPERLKNNNFTPYCVAKIHSKLARFLNIDHITYVPQTTYSDVKKRGETPPAIKVVPLHSNSQGESLRVTNYFSEYDYDSQDRIIKKGRRLKHLPKNKNTIQDLKEMIEKSIRTPDERKVITLRMQGFVDREIAEQMNCKLQWVHTLRMRVQQRYEQLENKDV